MFATNPHVFAQRIEDEFGARFEGLTTRVIDATDPYPTNRAKYASPAFPHYAQPLVKVEWTTRNAKTARVRKSVIVPTWSWDLACKTIETKLAEHLKAPTALTFEPTVADILRHYARTDSLAAIAEAIRKAGAHDKGIIAWQDQEYADQFAGENTLFIHSSSVGPLAFRPDSGVKTMKQAQRSISRKLDDVPAMSFTFRKGVVNLNLWDGRMHWETSTRTVSLIGDLPITVIASAPSMVGKPLSTYVDAPFAEGLKVTRVRTNNEGSYGAKIRLIYGKKAGTSSVKEKA